MGDFRNNGFGAGFLGDVLKDLRAQMENENKPGKKERPAGPAAQKENRKPGGRKTYAPVDNSLGRPTAMPAQLMAAGTDGSGNDALGPRSSLYRPGDLILDTYRVESRPIYGGMGAVWCVHHTGWDADLAMKRPRPEAFQTEKQKENFTAECRYWMDLGLHPNIVSCYYVREIDGIPTIFSEWMNGGSVEARIKDGTLYQGGPAEVSERLLDIAIQFARGLHFAHESSLIHQDVKPDNLLISEDWTVKVSDFGLARARTMLTFLEGDATQPDFDSDRTVMTPSGGRTPAYCSPEQAAGQLLTRRTDIYSWAVSILEMYLGRKPWAHGRECTGPLVGAACQDYFEMCTERPLPDVLQDLLRHCLEHDPDDRPRDFSEVEKALLAIYRQETGSLYRRSEPRAAADTAASLNNRALSLLDLGMEEEAKDLLKQAERKDASSFLYHFNYALLSWNRKEISDAAFRNYLLRNNDAGPLSAQVFDILDGMRGGFDDGKKVYSYLVRNGRPASLPPLRPTSDTSFDGRYRVMGYAEKQGYSQYRYGYRLEDLRTGEVRDFPNEYDDYGVSDAPGVAYMHPHYYKSDKVFFAGPRSEFIIMAADVLWIFDAVSGRLILSLPPCVDSDGDTSGYTVPGWMADGVIEYANTDLFSMAYGLKLSTDRTLSYQIARISTIDSRLEAEEKVEANYAEALAAWERKDVAGTYEALSRSLEDQVLAMHEPSLRLWSALREYYEPESLVTVVPTEDAPTPPPERYPCKEDQVFGKVRDYLNGSDNGQTRLVLTYREESEFDWCMDMEEYTFYYTLRAEDILSNKTYYLVSYLEVASEADWKWFSTDRYLGLQGDSTLWYAREREDPETIDLSEMSRKGEGRVRFTLPGGYNLKNTKEGVNIGGFIFEDLFTDFRPLWDSDVIACRDRSYRLVYRYRQPAD